MRVMLDVNPLERKKKTGIATYVDRLVRGLLTVKSDAQFTLWGADIFADPLPEFHNKQFIGRKLLSRDTLEALWREAGIGGIPRGMDVFHQLFASYPPRNPHGAKQVATIYDLAFAYYPESITEPAAFQLLTTCIPEQTSVADRIITISQSCADDMVNILGTPPEKISVIYPGNELHAPLPDAPLPPELASAGLPEKYLLCVGTWEPRKNLPSLFRAMHTLRTLCAEEDIYLCMTGLKGWKYQEAEQLIARLDLADRIVALGHVPRPWLPFLYNRAMLFVYPSMYEGFGMPVVEAQACGAPVITSTYSSLPEAGGDAALLVDTLDPQALAAAIEQLIRYPAKRAEMSAQGLARAAGFTWENAAEQHLAVYHSLC
jgi:glycosyltransferase involved in cell wall biosynthesis